MSEATVIDIIHNLSYNITGEEKLKQVSKEMETQIARTDQLTKRMFTLSNLYDKTSSTDVARRERIKRLIDETGSAIDREAKAIEQSSIKAAALTKNMSEAGGAVSGVTDVVETLTSGFSLLEGAGVAATAGISLGVTALIALLPKLIEFFTQLSDAELEAAAQLQLIKDVGHDANKIASEQAVNLDVLYKAATKVDGQMELRLKAVVALKKQFPDQFESLKTEAILNGQAADAYNKAAVAITNVSKAKASRKRLDDVIAQQRDVEDEKVRLSKKANEDAAKIKDAIRQDLPEGGTVELSSVADQRERIFKKSKAQLNELEKQLKKLKNEEQALKDNAGENGLLLEVIGDVKSGKVKALKAIHEIADIYLQEKSKLDERLASITASTLVDEETIRAKVKATFDKTIEEIDRNLKDGKLTKPEAADLRRRAGLISDAELEKEFKAYHEKQRAAQEALNSDIEKLQQKHQANMLALMKDDFDKQAEVIELNNKKQKEDLRNRLDDDIDKQEKLFADGIYGNPNSEASKQKLAENTQIIIDNYSQLYADVDAATEVERTKLSQKIFEKGIDGLKDLTEWALLHVDEDSAKLFTAITQQYLKGEIDYKKYQDAISNIARKARRERLELIRDELKSELAANEFRLKNGDPATGKKDDPAFIKKLEDENRRLRKLLAENGIDLANVDASEAVSEEQKARELKLQKINDFQALASASKEAADAIIADEKRVLDAQIAIQTKRVEAAQRIADRGNAELLQREEKRLAELQKKRDAAAKAELVTNNLLTISNAVLAVAKAAAAGFGYASVATVAAVIAALVAGYSAVRTLTNDTGGFKKGGYTGSGDRNEEAGVVHKGEFVLNAEATEKYRPLLEEMNKMRLKRTNLPPVIIDTWTSKHLIEQQAAAQIDYRKSFSSLEKRLGAIEEAIISKPNTSLTVDRNGIAASVEEVIVRRDRLRNL